ncbi:MAG TPA: hypothetical protein VHL57_06380 [Flavobacteriales bacterium]|jgi:hypothetical protein|nr:hypothetical protein [Flavobacteriales bacterium]
MEPYMPYRPPFWRLALGGVIAGTALYFFPFLLPALALVFLVGLTLRLVFGFGPRRRFAYAAHWKNMTEEERQRARAHFAQRCGHPWHDRPASATPNTPNA